MAKIEADLINGASFKLLGLMSWYKSEDRDRVKYFLKLAGITRGQWKRYLKTYNNGFLSPPLHGSEISKRKLEIIFEYAGSPHLETLLKMVNAQEADDDHK